MLGTEPQIIDSFVETGQARIVFWPVLNHGDASVYATLTAECVARQDGAAFWEIHHYLFTHQGELWGADRDYFIEAAIQVGADEVTFANCYDGGEALAHIMELDRLRRERGIYTQPVFDVNGQVFYGSQSFPTFSAVIESALAQ